ncbi:hypothetical protein BY996DRAFT_8026462 [Phakopsora pachyrhizi]|uniref:Expressed protein n=1 Tax=Phakopsora pachyrhizi TaxID=170000 RepID=A0AAV0BMW4_PHAPC|nr:hypothetical protein BY996DRAFT_8026462 [Phakopsora pachyrhizi]CAH7688635.1 expressed protein [Phakopsora pachyrhizi]
MSPQPPSRPQNQTHDSNRKRLHSKKAKRQTSDLEKLVNKHNQEGGNNVNMDSDPSDDLEMVVAKPKQDDKDDKDLKPTDPHALWKSKMINVMDRASPYLRFGAEQEWAIYKDDPFYNIENLVENNMVPLAIRAIGPQPQNPLTSNQIHQLLQRMNVRAVIVQKQELNKGWPNEFLVVIPINDALNLPARLHPHKGIFGYKELQVYLIWTCVPMSEIPVDRPHAMLRLRLVTPMKCIPTSAMRQAVFDGIYLEDSFDNGIILKPTDVDYEAHKGEDGTVYRSGNMLLTVTNHPTDPVFSRFWNNSKAQFLKGKVGNRTVRLELCDPCGTCGVEHHWKRECPFDKIIDNINTVPCDAKYDKPVDDNIQIVVTSKVIPAWKKMKTKPAPTNTGRHGGKDKAGAKGQGKRK